MDRCALLQFSEDGARFETSHIWTAAESPDPKRRLPSQAAAEIPWVTGRLLARQSVVFSNLGEIPEQAAGERAYAAEIGIQASALVPMMVETRVFGVLGVDMLRGPRDWDEETLRRLGLASEIFANALNRRRQWQGLHEREELLRTTLERAPAGVALADPEGRLVKVNPKFCQLMGYRADELRGRAIQGLTHPNDWDRSREIFDTLRRGHAEPLSHDKRYLRKDGSQLWASTHVSRLDTPAGELRYLAAVVVDISQRKAAEQGLQQAMAEVELLKRRLESENSYLRQSIALQHGHDEILGQSPAIRAVLHQVEQVAATDSAVLIQGETGTGKELVARAIHRLSQREGRTMVTVNCAALPASLIEAELFGREKGAYTGALTKQAGRFEAADGATLFLDEVGELPLEMQSKLLRVLQSGEFERVGSPASRRVDVRLLAATNRDLARIVEQGRFRQDLYYRLNVFPITLPPLRQRAEDIPALVWAFVRELGERMGKGVELIPQRSMRALQGYAWPGNVRELRNVIERAMILTRGERLEVDLPNSQGAQADAAVTAMAEVERRHLLCMLERSGWRVRGPGGAAELLGLKPSTLESRMKRHGIRRPG